MIRREKKSTGSQNIKVFLRVRPLNAYEIKNRVHSVVECQNNQISVPERILEKFNKKCYSFDRIFDQKSKQVEVYKSIAKPLVEEVLNGFNCTIFAYGQTGTGKTFTMEGEGLDASNLEECSNSGIIPRCVTELFDGLRIQQVEFTMKVSFLELYNEELFDLLSAHDDLTKLRLYECATQKGSCLINGLEEVHVRSKADVYKVLQKGSAKRQTAATLMNAHSSRSHTVFTITVHIKENTEDGDEVMKTGKLHLVDLAGSENIGRSGAIDKRAREACNINTSLLTLGRVINSIVDKAPHVPYRESKLTRLLQDALGGKTKTSIIATVSPSSDDLEETRSTLQYAFKAKNIKNCPEVNKRVNKREFIDEYSHEIDRLRRDLLAMREKDGVYLASDDYNDMMLKMEQQATEICEKIGQIRALEEEKEKQEDVLNSMSVQLQDTKETLIETKYNLEDTKDTLVCTQKLLADTENEKQEQIHLVSAHVKTEGKLHQQGQELIKTADNTTSDIDKLHDKLDRKRNVEFKNAELGSEFTQELSSAICSMRNDLVDEISQQKENSVRISKKLENLNNTQMELNGLCTFMEESLASTLESLENLTGISFDQLNTWRVDVNDFASTHEGICHNGKDHLEHFKTTIGNTTRNISSALSLASTIVQKGDSLSEKIKEVQSLSREASNYDASTLEKYQVKLTNLLSCHEREMTDEIDKLRKMFLGAIENLDRMDISKRKKINEITATNKEVHNVCIDMLERNSKLSKKACDVAVESDVLLKNDAEEMKSVLCDLENEKASLSKTFDKHMTDDSKQFEEMETLCSKMRENQFVKNEATLNLLSKMKKEHEETISTYNTKQISILRQEEKHISNTSEDINATLSAQSHAFNEFVNESEDKFIETNGAVKDFFCERIVKDIPTGLTPSRKDYSYPRELVATSPHPRILRRFRMASSTASRIPLPLVHVDSEDSIQRSDSQRSLSQSLESDSEDSIFRPPQPPKALKRQDGKETRYAPMSRSASDSSINELKENCLKDKGSSTTIKAPSDTKQSLNRPTRSRKVLGMYN